MFYLFAVILFLIGVACVAYDSKDVQLIVEGFSFILLSVLYANEGAIERRSKKDKKGDKI